MNDTEWTPITTLTTNRMAKKQNTSASEDETIQVTANDIQFDCPHCENILIIDKEGVGMELNCPHCSKMIVVPDVSALPGQKKAKQGSKQSNSAPQYTFDFADKSAKDLTEHIEKLSRRLKENASQRTEIQGYVNQETIKLHRHKLQLEKLIVKNSALQAELEAAKKSDSQHA